MNDRNSRIRFIVVVSLIVCVLIFAKLMYVQLLANEKFSQASLGNRLQEISIVPDRGIIYDTNGDALAISVKRESVYISPSEIRGLKDNGRETVSNELAKALSLKKEDVDKAIDRTDTDFVWLARQVPSEVSGPLKEKDFKGVGFTSEYKREYPKGRLAAQVLGFAGIDNQGLNGIELQFNDVLSGNSGKLIAERDGKGNIIPQTVRESIPATPGDNLYLTIDGTIQYIVERELEKVVQEYKPLQATCIVQEVKTGNILAMANTPNYDPNHYSDFSPESWKNLAISKVYEPGSVFKIASTSMYLDDAVATPESQYYCNGSIKIDGHDFRCWIYPRGHGQETLKQGLANSCNIVQAKSVARLGMTRFYDYLHGFGFTRKTGIELPAESDPILVPKDKAVPLDLAAMSIGQANAYTPIQMVNMISTIANGGNLMKAQIVAKKTNRQGDIIEETKPEIVRRVVSEQTAAQMRDMLEYVVTDGLGKAAAVPGYRVAGKTGTAEIAKGGRYEKGDYNLSFGGFAPVNDPKIACIVIVNSPKTNASSGTVAGPVFSTIVGDIMRYYNIPSTLPNKNITEPKNHDIIEVPDLKLPMNAEILRQKLQSVGLNTKFVTQGDTVYSYLPNGGTKVASGSTVNAYATNQNADKIRLPNLTGLTIKEVDWILSGFGFKADLQGSGLAWYQTPAAETEVLKGSQVQVKFASNSERQNIGALQEEQKKKEAEERKKANN